MYFVKAFPENNICHIPTDAYKKLTIFLWIFHIVFANNFLYNYFYQLIMRHRFTPHHSGYDLLRYAVGLCRSVAWSRVFLFSAVNFVNFFIDIQNYTQVSSMVSSIGCWPFFILWHTSKALLYTVAFLSFHSLSCTMQAPTPAASTKNAAKQPMIA